jgi:transcriptional regulator with XRE-family HTH domain
MAERSGEPGLTPQLIDQHVGRRVRVRRKLASLSQQQLAQALGLTFQQVQKYEKGSNRISASKLYQIAKLLAVPVAYFFEGLEAPADASATSSIGRWNRVIDTLMADPNGPDVAANFIQIRRGPVRRRVAELVAALADDDHEGFVQLESGR